MTKYGRIFMHSAELLSNEHNDPDPECRGFAMDGIITLTWDLLHHRPYRTVDLKWKIQIGFFPSPTCILNRETNVSNGPLISAFRLVPFPTARDPISFNNQVCRMQVSNCFDMIRDQISKKILIVYFQLQSNLEECACSLQSWSE